VLRRDRVDHKHFRAPTVVPVVGALLCAFLASPLSGRDPADYRIAGVLLVIGIVLWAITWALNRALYGRPTRLRDVEHLGG
jgi:basic amino acid/polyamine antiporter, APA family